MIKAEEIHSIKAARRTREGAGRVLPPGNAGVSEETRVLIVEDAPADAELAVRELGKAGLRCKPLRVETESDFLRQLEQFRPDLILCDFSLPRFDGTTALVLARDRHPDIPFIFVSGTIGEEVAIEALKRGATDYVLKTNLPRLGPSVQRALQETAERLKRSQLEAELASVRARANSIFNSLRDVVWSVSPAEKRMVYINAASEEVFGIPPERFMANPDLWRERVHEADRQRLRDAWERVTAGEPVGIEYRVLHRDGTVRWVENRAWRVQDGTTGEIRIDGIASDITERKQQEERILRLSRMERVLSGVNSAIARVRDRNELLHEACRIAVEDGGFAFAWMGLVDPDTLDIRPSAWAGEERGFFGTVDLSLRQDRMTRGSASAAAIRSGTPVVVNEVAVEGHPETGSEPAERRFAPFAVLPLTVDGETIGSFSFHARAPGFFDHDELKLLLDLAGDVSFALSAITKEERLNYLAYYDPLTGLPNRNLFHERVDQFVLTAQQTRGKVALLALDVERFSVVNNTLGRHAGDGVLREVGQRLRQALENRHPVARLGADSFGVVLAGIDNAADIGHLLEQTLSAAISRPFSVAGQELRPSFKCGVALYPGDAINAEALFRNAEAALKKAKASGQKYLFYAPQMNARVAEKLSLENRLRIAAAEGQFVLHYQPKVEIATHRITGLEALIRWRNPELGMVPPADFVPLLEETGLVLEVGRWVLRQALDHHRQWRSSGLEPPRIAVNVSPLSLRDANFTNDIKGLATEHGDAVLQLDLEITETLIMEDIEQSIAKLEAIKAAGIGIAIDDFGTGYSSLSYIARLPANSLKIDRSFIAGMTSSPHNMTIVSTIISLAHCLNLKVVAEGVETKEQLQLLRLLRCDEMQGYIYSPPVPAEDIERIIARS